MCFICDQVGTIDETFHRIRISYVPVYNVFDTSTVPVYNVFDTGTVPVYNSQ